jgi:MFS family permease
MEKGLNIPKIIGDTAGVSMFAFMLGLGRLLHGIYGKKFDLSKVMTMGCILAILCYLVVAFSTISFISLIACALSGFAVSLLWPGTLVLASEKYPLAGTWMFAILAAGGDIGASAGPWLMGFITDNAPKLTGLSNFGISAGLNPVQLGLRTGMFIGTLFPIGALVCLLWISKKLKAESQE